MGDDVPALPPLRHAVDATDPIVQASARRVRVSAGKSSFGGLVTLARDSAFAASNPGTEKTNRAMWRKWLTYCDVYAVHAILTPYQMPQRETIMCAFLGFLLENGVRNPDTIRHYVYAVRSFHVAFGVDGAAVVPISAGMPAFRWVFEHLVQTQRLRHPRRAKVVPSLSMVVALFRSWDESDARQLAVKAATVVATFTGRRMGDMLPQHEHSYNALLNLTVGDVQIMDDAASVVCRTTKNRPVGSGMPPWIGCLVANDADPLLCPLRVLKAYFGVLRARSASMTADDPFFQLPNTDGRFNGVPLSTAAVRDHTQGRLAALFPGYGPSVYFRLWTANILIAAGLTPDEQERYNDWSHTSRMRYAHTVDPMLVPVQRKLFVAFARA